MTENSISVSVKTAAQMLDASESYIRGQIREGHLKAKRYGTRVSIAVADLHEFCSGLPAWSPGQAPKAANAARRKA